VSLGGIYSQELNKTVTKVPLLGDIPILGMFFRQEQNSNNRTELLIFVTPRIMRETLTAR
jgi:type IV pilus assembly protein PilQ